MVSLNPLSFVRDRTGKLIRLGYDESVADFKLDGDTMALSINRARGRECGRGGRDFRITQRGVTIYTWRWDGESWLPVGEPVTLWWSTDELHTASMPRQRDIEWEILGLKESS